MMSLRLLVLLLLCMQTVDSYSVQIQDKSHHPDDSVRETIQKGDDGIAGERKFIVFES